MATYKKRGAKQKHAQTNIEDNSTTAEVFNTLDETASKSEQWVIKNQKGIFVFLALVVAGILGFMGYQKYIQEPIEREAANELAFPKVYFEDASSNTVAADSLYTLALNGADGKYGFIDVADEYSSTKAGNLANYYAGISYLRLKNYTEAINYLDKFSSEDELLGAIAKGSIGDAFADLNQAEDAFDYYMEAANLRTNNFTTPLYLFKAGNTAMELENYSKAKDIFETIKRNHPNATEAKDIDIYINKATYAKK